MCLAFCGLFIHWTQQPVNGGVCSAPEHYGGQRYGGHFGALFTPVAIHSSAATPREISPR